VHAPPQSDCFPEETVAWHWRLTGRAPAAAILMPVCIIADLKGI
jgi:hypothetical protein